MRYALTATTLVLLLMTGSVAFAQSIDAQTTVSNPFTISINPQYPTPYSQATLSFLSSTLNLTNSALNVSVGGKQIYQGSVKPVSVPVGRAGSVTSVTVTISSSGIPYNQSVVIQPQDVSLIAEPLSSVPPLYLGKTLVPMGGNIRVVAIAAMQDAGGKKIDPATLSYAWAVDGVQIANSSGIGKSAIVVASPIQYRTRSVSVVVQSQSGSLVGGGDISLTTAEPTVRIYENDPLLGVRFDHALSGTYPINKSEMSFYAASFSFPVASDSLILNWFLNGNSAQKGSLITLRPSGTGQGISALSFVASWGGSTQATADLSLSFGTKTSNFFGL